MSAPTGNYHPGVTDNDPHFDDWEEREPDEPPEPDGECFRGGEAAAYEAEQMARIQRELK